MPNSGDSPITILYVDDEPGLLTLGKTFLETNGAFLVEGCQSALDAVHLLKQRPYDAIISDFQMPKCDGISFLKYLREKGDDTPFIILTGKGREEVVIEALNNGADFYLEKGGDLKAQFAELSNIIRYAVARRRSEEALRESEERYRNVVLDQTELICRFSADGTVLFVNDAYCRYFGVPCKEIIGSRFKPVIHPEDSETVTLIFSSLSPEKPQASIDQRTIAPDGRILWQRWNTRAIFGEDGSLREFQSVGQDITQRKKAEEALIESERRYRSLFASMRDGYAHLRLIQDKNGNPSLPRIIDINPAFEQITGLPREEILDKTLPEVLPDVDLIWDEECRKTTEIGEPRVFEITLSDPSRFFELSLYSPRTGECATLFHDITEKKKRNEETKQSLREKETLLKEIHHRVKNNMQVISSLLMLQKETIPDPEMRELFSQSESRVYSIALVHEKLYQSENLSRIEYGEYLSMMGEYIFSSRQVKAGTIVLDIHADDIYLSIDKAVPLSLITNELLTNSLKHAFPDGRKGTIRIDAEKKESTIIYRFSDDGIGFPEDIDFTNTTTLGMQLVTSLVNQLLGTITLRREKGTAYEIVFPVDPGEYETVDSGTLE